MSTVGSGRFFVAPPTAPRGAVPSTSLVTPVAPTRSCHASMGATGDLHSERDEETMTSKPGVLQQERERQAHWAALGLRDPLVVLHEEQTTREIYGPDHYRHPDRERLDRHFAEHPERRPSNWAHPYDKPAPTGDTPND